LRDGEYAWLADLARLEWACEEAAVAGELEAKEVSSLAAFAPEDLERLRFGLQPSLRLISSAFPIFSVWFANQRENAPPVEQSAQFERGMTRIRNGDLEVQVIAADVYAYLDATVRGANLGDAMQAAALHERRLVEVLGFLFSNGLVVSITLEDAREGS
jgi:hypothetical protein